MYIALLSAVKESNVEREKYSKLITCPLINYIHLFLDQKITSIREERVNT